MHRKGSRGWRGQEDGADSGAETGGSEYSHVSSSSSDLSVRSIQDPFLVSAHIIADPGESSALQQAIDNLLVWIHPDLRLFQVSERRVPRTPRKRDKGAISQPALAIILFLQEEEDEEPILQLHKAFQKPPWHYHHTEQVGGNFLPYMPGGQDFFILVQGTPLWAIRPVHYGKEIIRFTIYCSNENFDNIMKLYELVLRRPVSQKRADFCIFLIYSNVDIDIQFSLKRLPRGHIPRPTDSAVLEFRVRDIGHLVPLLPNPCSPISEGRWQTEDPDGNKILLQARHKKYAKQNRCCWPSPSRNLPDLPLLSFVPHSDRLTPNKTSNLSKPAESLTFHHTHQCIRVSRQDLRSSDQEYFPRRPGSACANSDLFQRSRSLVCLPTTNSSLGPEASHFSRPSLFLSTFSSGCKTRTRVKIDDLEGVQETDVDTGMTVAFSDLSVVSAYSVPDGFSNDLEGTTKCPAQKHGVSRYKQAVSDGRSISTKSNPFELPSSPLPFPFAGSSSSSASSSIASSGARFEIKYLPRGSLVSWDDSRTTGGGKSIEEEFFI
ncbi:protein FAM124A isoform X2 [Eublepharis macularius]|uniref:Protein FAM124A isoform X2 n=1 Tax=Eublepharis macularius TaxID=481883 RepID=A0AA97KH71_EUBMA|nr:protein FAM124A isoform X2 [Eublepharis macularius]